MKRIRYLLWAAIVVAGIAVFAVQQLDRAQKERTEKGDLGRVPTFSLIDQQGTAVTDRDLRGAPWVANFVFTRCPTSCPLLTAKFKAFQATMGPLAGVRYVSFSVDPEHDTPEVLAKFAQKFEVDPARWQFLTGSIAAIEQTVVRGFKIHIGEPTASEHDPTLVDIMHGEHFVLVDGDGTIRGYYRADEAELEDLGRDLRALAEPTVAHLAPDAQLVQ